MLRKEIPELVSSTPQDCLCEVELLPSVLGKSYGLSVECNVCKAQRELNIIISAKQRRKQEIQQELNQLDLSAIRPLIDKDDIKIGEIKTKKDLLRTELLNIK